MPSNRLTLTLARLRLEAVRQNAVRRMQGLDKKAVGFMESRGWTDADLDRKLTSGKVLRGLQRDLNAVPNAEQKE